MIVVHGLKSFGVSRDKLTVFVDIPNVSCSDGWDLLGSCLGWHFGHARKAVSFLDFWISGFLDRASRCSLCSRDGKTIFLH